PSWRPRYTVPNDPPPIMPSITKSPIVRPTRLPADDAGAPGAAAASSVESVRTADGSRVAPHTGQNGPASAVVVPQPEQACRSGERGGGAPVRSPGRRGGGASGASIAGGMGIRLGDRA